MINPKNRVDYANRFLSRLLAWAKMFGVKCKITTKYPDGSVVLVLEDFAKTRNTTISPTMDASKRNIWRIKINDDINIRFMRIYGKGVKVNVYYLGKIIGTRMIKPDEYIDISRYFSAEDETLDLYGLIKKNKDRTGLTM